MKNAPEAFMSDVAFVIVHRVACACLQMHYKVIRQACTVTAQAYVIAHVRAVIPAERSSNNATRRGLNLNRSTEKIYSYMFDEHCPR
jgi:hypothetical protein